MRKLNMLFYNRAKLIHCVAVLLPLVFSQQVQSGVEEPSGSAPWVGVAFSGAFCRGENPINRTGPYDYRVSPKVTSLVENNHFSAEVENLVRGKTGDGPMEDINFVLVRIPNHHRALNSVIRFHRRQKTSKQSDHIRSPAECYLLRAINYVPDDAVVYMLYGILLQGEGQLDAALEQYTIAERLSPDDPYVKYNLALLYVEMGSYDEAKEYASDLYSNRFPLPGLKNKLIAAGQWE